VSAVKRGRLMQVLGKRALKRGGTGSLDQRLRDRESQKLKKGTGKKRMVFLEKLTGRRDADAPSEGRKGVKVKSCLGKKGIREKGETVDRDLNRAMKGPIHE